MDHDRPWGVSGDAVTRVPTITPGRVVLRIAEMLIHLGFQAGLEDPLGQTAQQPVRADQVMSPTPTTASGLTMTGGYDSPSCRSKTSPGSSASSKTGCCTPPTTRTTSSRSSLGEAPSPAQPISTAG